MLNIVTDSCSDLNQELVQKSNIKVLPLQVFINGQTFRDGEVSTEELFRLVEKTGALPKTSAIPIVDFLEGFAGPDGSLFIGISSKLSATVPNSQLAVEQLGRDDIKIVDSLNLSTGIGLLVLKAVDLRDQGYSLEQILAEIERIIPRVRTSFVIDTMEYLYKGGRCTALQAIFGSMLKIRPVIEVRPDGTLGVKDKVRGTRQKALNSLVEDFKSHLDQVDLQRVFITHTGCDEDAEFLAVELKKLAPIHELLITRAGATIASHCGPGTIGVLYFQK
jgi:DegV family protein with EDD domain